MWTSSFADARRFLRARWLRPGAGLLVLALLLGHATGHLELATVRHLDRQFYDFRLRLLAPQEPDPRIAVVAIDDRALAELGRWPWSRDRLATLIERLMGREGALLVGLDLILAEADGGTGLQVLDRLSSGALGSDPRVASALAELRPAFDHDRRLAQVLAQRPVVLGLHLTQDTTPAPPGSLPPPALPAATLGERLDDLPRWPGLGGNLPLLQQAAGSAGFLNALPDADGVTRSLPLLAVHGRQVHAALSLVMARQLAGGVPIEPQFARAAPWGGGGPLEALALRTAQGLVRVPTDAQGHALIPFRGAQGGFARHSAADVVAGRLPTDALRGKVVLVGFTAAGLLDQRATPLAEAEAGVMVHASMLAGLLDGTVRAQPAYAPALEAALLLGLAAVLFGVLPRLGLSGALLLAGGLFATVLALNFLLWAGAHLALPAAGPLLLVPALLAFHLFRAHFAEALARRRLAALFGQYVPPELVDEMSRQPHRYNMASRSAELTVMFADIRGFTRTAEHLPPAELTQWVNAFMSTATEIIRAHRGTLDKYVGDCVMAFWGAPVADAQHAHHAVQAALALQEALPALNRDFAARGWPPLQVNIGINTGPMVVGDVGSRHRRAYTVLGDAVNLAARLQEECGHQQVNVLVGEATRAALGERLCLEIGAVQVRGRGAQVKLFHPLPWQRGDNPAMDAQADAWHRALAQIQAEQWAPAAQLLDGLLATAPDHPLYAARRRWVGERLAGAATPAAAADQKL